MLPHEQIVRAFDGLELVTRRYDPSDATGDGRTLVIVHGASEHGRRYDHVARFFADRGWTVICGDNRGHGKSGGVPMHVDQFEDYLRDLDSIWGFHRLNPARTALLGHSFGSLMTARYAETRPHQMAALVLLAPLLRLKVEVNPLIVGWGKLVSFFAPTVRFTSRVDPRDTTRDQNRLLERNFDPLIHRSVTCGWFFQMRAALNAVWQDVSALRLPLLVMQGGGDRIVDPEVVREWLDRVPGADKELKWFPEHFHELHNELDWQNNLSLAADWLDVRMSAESCSQPALCQ